MDDAQAPTIVNLGDGALNRTPEGVFCMKCRYDLRGLPLDGLCPECGTGVRDSIPLGCVGCAYDLRGLRESDSCPECGLPVATSLARNLRIGADLGFVRRLRSGLSWVLNGILVYLVFAIAAMVGGIAMQQRMFMQSPGQPIDATAYIVVQAGGTVLALLALLAMLWGYWVFTTPDPGDPGRLHDPASRKVLRVGTVVLAIGSTINAAAGVYLAFGMAEILTQMMAQAQQQSGSATGTPPPATTAVPGFQTSFLVASIVSGLAGLVIYAAMGTMFFSSMLYLRRLALRVPDMKIHRLGKTRMIACPIWATVGILILIGPLIALVLYWNLHNLLIKQLRSIVQDRERAGETPTPAIAS
jgi:hypothetical protein